MDTLQLLLNGLTELFTLQNLLIMFIGLLIGMAVGTLPGLGMVTGVVLALPFTYSMPLTPSIVLLTAIYMAGTYGGCFTAILYRIPGEPMDVPLMWDGFAMTRRGEAAKALGWALVAAFVGGLVSCTVMVFLAKPISQIGLSFGAPEYFAAVFFGLTTVVALGGNSLPNALISLCIGLLVSTIGIDRTFGAERFTFGSSYLMDGVPYVIVLVGMYGFGEMLSKIGNKLKVDAQLYGKDALKTKFPTWREMWEMRPTFLRSLVLGSTLGAVPGCGATITSFVAYGIEKQYGKHGDQVGYGRPEGIVAPQIASTASVAGHLMPLLTLGIPGSGATAVILAAFLLHGVQPGPFMFSKPESVAIVYTIFASMFVAVIGMCIMSFGWIRVVIRALTIPQGVLAAIIIMLCLIGAYSERNSVWDMWLILIFGVLSWLLERSKFPVAPMVLGAILGDVAEDNFVRSMITFHNDWTIFFRQPISGTLMALSIAALAYPLVRMLFSAKNNRPLGAAMPLQQVGE